LLLFIDFYILLLEIILFITFVQIYIFLMDFASISTYSIKKASQRLGVSPSYISYLIAEGELDFFLPPGKKHKRVPHKAIEEFIERYTYNNKQKDEE
jgi:excisionase family DNA binding protein